MPGRIVDLDRPRGRMRRNLTLTITSFLSLALFSLHLTEDTLHARNGMDAQGTVICLLIMLVYLYGIVELAGRPWGFDRQALAGEKQPKVAVAKRAERVSQVDEHHASLAPLDAGSRD